MGKYRHLGFVNLLHWVVNFVLGCCCSGITIQSKKILPLTGTTNPIHMAEDLDILNFELSSDDLGLIEDLTD